MAVEITRTELSASDLRREAAKAKDARASRRMLALALVLEGKSRTDAAESCGMDRQTLRDWVHRYNAEGLGGLRDRPLPGRPPRLSAEQMQELATIVETGPDPVADELVRWRRIDLCAVVERRFDIRLAERTMGEILRRLGFTRLSVRPRHPQGDPEAQGLYKQRCRSGARGAARGSTRQAAGDLVSGVSRARKGSGGPFSRRTQGLVSRGPSHASGDGKAHARGRQKIAVTPRPAYSAPYARPARPAPRSSCRT